MRISKLRSGNLSLTYIDPVEADAFISIPLHAKVDGIPEAEHRLFPPPVDGTDGGALQEDWNEYVVPDLRRLFSDGLEKVRDDLAKLQPQKSGQAVRKHGKKSRDDESEPKLEPEVQDALDLFLAALEKGELPDEAAEESVVWMKMVIPRKHVEVWYRAMNQARLVMCEREIWVEDGGKIHGPMRSQIHYEIYTSLQWWLVENILSKS